MQKSAASPLKALPSSDLALPTSTKVSSSKSFGERILASNQAGETPLSQDVDPSRVELEGSAEYRVSSFVYIVEL